MKPICTQCQQFYRCKENGVFFIEGMPTRHDGAAEPDAWKPYKIWSGDLWECKGCGSEIIVGCGRQPIAEHYEPDFEETMGAYKARVQINDC